MKKLFAIYPKIKFGSIYKIKIFLIFVMIVLPMGDVYTQSFIYEGFGFKIVDKA
jgi:hypothetical protein